MKTLLFLMLVGMSTLAHSGCSLDGEEYPVGAVVEGYVCTEEGYWEPA